jgi:hypothetical protein
MGPIIFQTLPEVFSFLTVAALLQVCILLLFTGRRYLKQVSFVAVGIAVAFVGENVALLVLPAAAWFAIAGGLACGVLLCYYLRPVGMGVALAFLGFYGSSYLVSVESVQYVVALVLFAYGLLLTDLAPTFAASLLASAILFLSGIWLGVPMSALVSLISGVAAARVLTTILPPRPEGRGHGGSSRAPYR